MVLCDICDAGYHIDCLEPKLLTIPEGEWICEECSQPKDKKKRRSNAEEDTSDALGRAASGVQLKKRRQSSDGKIPNGESGVAV
jgi:PHD and RING finger domain-containing protein 1